MRKYLKKIDPSLLHKTSILNKSKTVSCVIYANNFFALKNHLSKNNIRVYFEYPFINAYGIKVKANDIKVLAKIKQVKYITSNTKVFAQINVAKKIIHVDEIHKKGFMGSGISIAIIDTGIKPHLDFSCPKNRIVMFKDFVGGNKFPYDDNGHGTFVAGIACGSGLVSKNKFGGIAPKANIISLKTLDSQGETGAFSILEAMQWVYDNHKKYNIKVVCMSFGSNPLGSGDPLTLGAESLWNKGITVVAAAGNSGPDYNSIKSPGVSPKIITVGALDDKRTNAGLFDKSNFEVADFSSRGPAFNRFKPDILAPGVNLSGTSHKKGFYTTLSGTSVATPIVAGLAVLMHEKYPKITPNEVKGLLIKNSKSIGLVDRNLEGYGLIDAINLFE